MKLHEGINRFIYLPVLSFQSNPEIVEIADCCCQLYLRTRKT